MYAAVTIMAVLTLLAAGLAATVRKIIHDREIHKYYEAARRIIQEEHLNYAIKNPLNGHGERPQMQKIMLCLKTENNRKNSYVFDPEKGIHIGRDSEKNEICLQDVTVSGEHCRIFLYQDQIYLQDCMSANGTFLKKGIRRPHVLHGNAEVLRSKDRIYVGNTVFRTIIFYCDMLTA